MEIHPFKAWLPKTSADSTESDRFFRNVKTHFQSFLTEGYFRSTEQPAIFYYDIERQDRCFRGLIGLLDIQHYESGLVCPHEQTLLIKERKQLNLLLERQAAVKPVLLTFDQTATLEQLINRLPSEQPLLNIPFDHREEVHRLYAIQEEEVQQEIQLAFNREVNQLFIADGHHRISASYQLSLEGGHLPSRVLSAFFPVSALEIHNFNRVVQLPFAVSSDDLQRQLKELVDWEHLAGPIPPQRPHELTIYLNSSWHRLHWKPRLLERIGINPVKGLDAQLVNDYLIRQALGIKDVRTAEVISYIEGPKGLSGLEQATDRRLPAIGIALYPIEPAAFFSITRSSGVLPPKSTWFEPRIPNGLVVYYFGEQTLAISH